MKKIIRKISAYTLASLMLTALLIGIASEPDATTSITGIILFKGTMVGVAIAIGILMRDLNLFSELQNYKNK